MTIYWEKNKMQYRVVGNRCAVILDELCLPISREKTLAILRKNNFVILEVDAGDVIFVSGRINYYYDDPSYGVGHVGVATGEETVIHAANSNIGVVESSIVEFLGEDNFRGARRYIPKDAEVITFETPLNSGIETSDDFRWIILQSI